METLKIHFPGAVAAIEGLSKELGLEAVPMTCSSLAGSGGSYGELQRLTWTDGSGQERLKLIVKTVPESEQKLTISKVVGLYREAKFFNTFGKDLERYIRLPKTFYADSDMVTGRKVIVMEDLENVTQSGYFFGPGSPLNHGKDLKALCAHAGSPPLKEIVRETFRAAAELHARYWMDSSLLEIPWLRGSSWMQDSGKELWVGSQQSAADNWAKFKSQHQKGEASFQWPESVIELMDASIAKISWESFSTCGRPWTLVHGDFHPANMMWRHGPLRQATNLGGDRDVEDDKRPCVVFLDWELVGLGSGPQDLGQYMISHMDPVVRKECEKELVRDYYDHLVSVFQDAQGKACTYTWEQCWSEYIAGGTGRWMWFLAYFAANGNDTMQEYFVKQVMDFANDHGVTPETVGQPRS